MANFREFMRDQFHTDNDMYSFKTDDEIFEAMADFITSLEPDQLSEDQIETVLDILEEIEVESTIHDVEDDDLDDDVSEKRLAGRTKVKTRLAARKYYKRNRSKIKKRKKKFKKSAAGKVRKRKAARMAKAGKTATGRKKVRYHR